MLHIVYFRLCHCFIFASIKVNTRGGLEDTRLEAKDTKKIRGQGQPFRGQTLSRPRTGMLEAKGQGPRTQAQVLSKTKKKGHHKNFSGDLQKKKKKVFTKIFQAISTKKRFPKKRPRAEDRPIFEGLRPRGQGQGLDLRGQELQNLSSRTSSRPRTSSRTPPLVNTLQ